jgi:myo-inositol-1(or 4)-monophosphatase
VTADELRRLAAELSVEAGTLARSARDVDVSVDTKSTRTDLVTEHDRAAEGLLVDALRTRRPGDAIIGEEGAARVGTSGLTWYLDPIDGTTNFVHDHPMWATSVAVSDDDGMLAGAVYAPASGELFTAARGAGATLDGRALTASSLDDLGLALVATGFSYHPAIRARQGRQLAEIAGQVGDVRRGGSAALDLCYVAAGRVDCYYEGGLNIWDTAAGELIAREAGCITWTLDNASTSVLFASAPGVAESFRDLMRAVHD